MSPTPGMPLEPTDPTSLAVAIARLQGDQAILSREVATNIQNLTSCTTALQGDVRHLSDQLADVARLQQQQVSHSEWRDRAFKAIEKLTTRLEGGVPPVMWSQSYSNYAKWGNQCPRGDHIA